MTARSLALVIGLDGYQSLPRLPGAMHGAEAVGWLLRRRFGFEVSALFNQQATRGAVSRELDRLSDPQAARVIVYVATRVLSEQTLALYNTDPKTPATGWLLDRLIRQLDALPAPQVLLLLDAEISPFTPPLAIEAGRLILCAGPKAWQTRERWGDHDASLFTAQIIYGLRGNAADSSGLITGERLGQYVIADVQQVSPGQFVPWAAPPGASASTMLFQETAPVELPRELTDNLRSGVSALRYRAIDDIARLIEHGDDTVRALAIAQLREVAAESDIGSARKMAEDELLARKIALNDAALPVWREPAAERPGSAPQAEPSEVPEPPLPGDRRQKWIMFGVMALVAATVIFLIVHFS